LSATTKPRPRAWLAAATHARAAVVVRSVRLLLLVCVCVKWASDRRGVMHAGDAVSQHESLTAVLPQP
jgi:hypothetical protein